MLDAINACRITRKYETWYRIVYASAEVAFLNPLKFRKKSYIPNDRTLLT